MFEILMLTAFSAAVLSSYLPEDHTPNKNKRTRRKHQGKLNTAHQSRAGKVSTHLHRRTNHWLRQQENMMQSER